MTDLELMILNAAFEDELEKIAMLGTLFGVAKKAPKAVPRPSTKYISGLGNVGRGAQTQVRTAGTATGKAWTARKPGGSGAWGVAPAMTKLNMARMSPMEKAAFFGKIMPAIRGMMGGARKAPVRRAVRRRGSRLAQIQAAGGPQSLVPKKRPDAWSRMSQHGTKAERAASRAMTGARGHGAVDSGPGITSPLERMRYGRSIS